MQRGGAPLQPPDGRRGSLTRSLATRRITYRRWGGRAVEGAGLENRTGSADNGPSDHEKADSDADAETLARVLVAEPAEVAEVWPSLDEPTRAEILRLAGVERSGGADRHPTGLNRGENPPPQKTTR